ncbi:MAG: outer membrane beta-barrel protein, partial [Pseudomonadota bacterium]
PAFGKRSLTKGVYGLGRFGACAALPPGFHLGFADPPLTRHSPESDVLGPVQLRLAAGFALCCLAWPQIAQAQTQTQDQQPPPSLGGLRSATGIFDPLVVLNPNTNTADPAASAGVIAAPPDSELPLTTGTPRLRGTTAAAAVESADLIGPIGAPENAQAAAAATVVSNAAGPTFAPTPPDDPYAPEPLRLGMFNVNGEGTLTYGKSTNVSNSAGGTEGQFSSVQFEGGAVSDWSRHQLRFASAVDMDLNRGTGRNRPTDIDLEAFLRLDLGEASAVTLGAGYGLSTEDASSPNALITGSDNPFLSEYSLDIAYERNAGLIGLQLRGGLTAARYGDIQIAGQPNVSQTSRDRNGATLGARLGYNGGGRITPFVDVEYELGRRVTALDAAGFNRNFNGMRATVGADVDLTGKLSGSLQAGYSRRDYADVRLPNIGGLIVEGNLDWQATDRLRVGLNLNSEIAGQSTPGVSGSIARGAGASVDWQATDALAFGLNAGVTRTNYSNAEQDTEYTVSASADYWLTPHAGVTAQVGRTQLQTNRVGAAYSATSVEFGLKVRH